MKENKFAEFVTRSYVNVLAASKTALTRVSDDRGDVPGWVLVTVMTAGLVVAIWSVADGQLKSVLSGALHSVSQP